MKWLLALALFAAPALAQADGLVGRTYDEVIKGSPFDPARKATGLTRQAFTDTLNGPQTPGVIVSLGGREFIVYETCTAHLCAFSHSVTAIDTRSGETYAAVYGDNGKTIIVPDPVIERLVGDACSENRCDFQKIVATGSPFRPEPLSRADMTDGFPGGAACTALDDDRRAVLYTEGVAVMRFHGQLRHLREDGIGTSPLYSVDHEPPMVVTLTRRPGRAIGNDEITLRPMTLTVLMNNRTVAIPVLMKCES
ncbi:MAG: hypothetical protein DI537_40840 [Stutzerimonas stutzeri]|nr:MAG: hypothetical protein DI537_40840 [Stutzerimonas stutzeri]